MHIARILALVFFAAVALGDITGSSSGQIAAGGSATISLTGSSTAELALLTLLGAVTGTSTGASISVTSSAAASVNIALSLTSNAYAGINLAGSASTNNAPFAALSSTLVSNGLLGISLMVTPSTPTTLTLTLTTPSIAASASASGSANAAITTQLLAGYTDASASASGSATVYGAVAFSVSGSTTTYTLPAGFAPQLFLVAVNSTQALAASSSASAGAQSSSSSIGGSANFNFAGKFIPVAYNSAYNLAVGQQYTFGNNIYVTPISSSAAGSAAGALNISYVGSLQASANSNGGASASIAPSQALAYFSGYYQISGSANANNVLQWTSTASSNFVSSAQGSATITAQQAASTYGNAITWIKSNAAAGAQAAANTWTTVQSNTQVSASGKLSVYANVNSYSQWTVAATANPATTTAPANPATTTAPVTTNDLPSRNDATQAKVGLFVFVAAILAMLF